MNSHMSRHTTNNPDQPQIHKAAVPNTAVRSSAVTTGCATSLATMNRTGKETTTHAMKNTPRTGPHTVRTSDQTCDHVGGTCQEGGSGPGGGGSAGTRASMIRSPNSAVVSRSVSEGIATNQALFDFRHGCFLQARILSRSDRVLFPHI